MLPFRFYIQVYAQHVLAVHDGHLYELVFFQWRGQWLVRCDGISLRQLAAFILVVGATGITQFALEAKSKEEGVKALPKGIYYKVPLGFSASADNTQRMMMSFSHFLMTYDINHNPYYSYSDIYITIKI